MVKRGKLTALFLPLTVQHRILDGEDFALTVQDRILDGEYFALTVQDRILDREDSALDVQDRILDGEYLKYTAKIRSRRSK
jgi:hypothetical protein